ncbi:unnamed protein product [Arabidopsis thaliana]|uniref:(thale cress) hypothetical protein n=1 Tax=Arabidopsis thaliana TaxID=3702 RepID=A0A7G2FKK7_ARATH|nr:unnamed protein product [Arabidopsis thaliana]
MHGGGNSNPASLLPKGLDIKLVVPPPIIKARGNRRAKKKCITRLWDQNIPTELLQEILSRLVLKANILASVVCKTWCEAAVSFCYEVQMDQKTETTFFLGIRPS